MAAGPFCGAAVRLLFVAWVERRTDNRFFRASVRMLFNPSRVLSNLAQSRAPWSRAGRHLSE